MVILSEALVLSKAKELSAFPGVWLLSERFFTSFRMTDSGCCRLFSYQCRKAGEETETLHEVFYDISTLTVMA